MAYADPLSVQTTDPGDILTAAWCDQVRDDLEFLVDPPVCVVSNSTSPTLTTDVTSYLSANSETADNAAMHSTLSSTSRITANTAGRHLLIATVDFAASATGERDLRFRVNGTTVLASTKVTANTSGSQTTTLTAVRMVDLLAADYVEIGATQRSGGNLTCTLKEFGVFWMTR